MSCLHFSSQEDEPPLDGRLTYMYIYMNPESPTFVLNLPYRGIETFLQIPTSDIYKSPTFS